MIFIYVNKNYKHYKQKITSFVENYKISGKLKQCKASNIENNKQRHNFHHLLGIYIIYLLLKIYQESIIHLLPCKNQLFLTKLYNNILQISLSHLIVGELPVKKIYLNIHLDLLAKPSDYIKLLNLHIFF